MLVRLVQALQETLPLLALRDVEEELADDDPVVRQVLFIRTNVIEALLPKVDGLLVGGAMACTFFRAMGLETGKSIVEDERIGLKAGLFYGLRMVRGRPEPGRMHG